MREKTYMEPMRLFRLILDHNPTETGVLDGVIVLARNTEEARRVACTYAKACGCAPSYAHHCWMRTAFIKEIELEAPEPVILMPSFAVLP